MSQLDMAMILDGQVLPYPKRFFEITVPNETDNFTLGGTLYTDFINYGRSWRVEWENMTREDYLTVLAIWQSQYVSPYRYKVLQFDARDVYTTVKINMSPERNLKHNAALVGNFAITLIEQYAIS